MVSSIFSSRLEDFLHFHSEYFSGLLEWFLLFFNLLMKNEKEILIKCIYLITLMLFRTFQILLKVSLVFGFLLLNVLFVFKQFTNFNECDTQGGLCSNSLPFLRYLLSQNSPGLLVLINYTTLQFENLYMI